jgi:Protein of unknown function (DUF3089)
VARKFLIFIAVVVALILIAGIAWSMFSDRIMRLALVPSTAFVEQKPMAATIYADRKMWIARPDIAENPALWEPTGFTRGTPNGNAAIFFIHPTSYLDRSFWNAPLDDATTNDRAALFVRGQASAFNGVGDVWAPRYRQAAFGAFLTTRPEAQRALDAAYRDVVLAWDEFLARVPADRPIIVAGHSQGSVHLLRLLRERVAGQAVARRIVAAYVVGWPVSLATDLPTLGLPACTTTDQSGCILSWHDRFQRSRTKGHQTPLHQSADRHARRQCPGVGEHRHRRPDARPEGRNPRSRHDPGALRRPRIPAHRAATRGHRHIYPARQQLSCLRLQPVLVERPE